MNSREVIRHREGGHKLTGVTGRPPLELFALFRRLPSANELRAENLCAAAIDQIARASDALRAEGDNNDAGSLRFFFFFFFLSFKTRQS